MRTVQVGSLVAVAAMLGTLVLAAAPAQACSLTGSPTQCVTAIYNAQKGSVSQRINEASVTVQVLPGQALACPSVRAGVAPPSVPGAPDLNPVQRYGADVTGDASNFTVSPSLSAGANAARLVTEAYDGAIAVALVYDNQATVALVQLLSLDNLRNTSLPPALPAPPDPSGALGFAGDQAGQAAGAAQQTVTCLTMIPSSL